MMSSSSIARLIKQHELFRGFSPEVVENVLRQSQVKQLRAEEVLFQSDTANSSLFLVLSGELRVILRKGATKLSIPIHPGECLGEMSLIEELPTSAMAVCHADGQVLVITEEVFWKNLAVSRQGVKNLMRIMSQRLHRNNQALIEEIEEQLKYEQLKRDFETAGTIQANIVPNGSRLFPQYPEVDVYAHTKQARAVGGDFYDALVLDQERIYVAIGDATGKGMPAALFMMRAFTSLRYLVSNCNDLVEVLPALNRSLLKENDDMMFVSLWIGVFHLKTGMLQYVNGGHHPPFAALQGKTFQPLALPGGPIVGVVEEADYEVATLALAPGDTIFLYTDGLPEAYDMNKVVFDNERIQASLNHLDTSTMKSLVCGMEDEVANFVQEAPTHDDLTMVGFRYVGNDA